MIKSADRKLPFLKTLLLLAASSLTITSLAQTSAPPLTPPLPLVAASVAAAPPVFEAATVKINKSGSSGSHSDFDDGRYSATNIALKNLMHRSAYGVPEPRILGGPKWLDSERFDIEAKVDSSFVDQMRTLSPEQRKLQRQAMFQQLLADRFKLAVHWETLELPVYALVVAKNGPKLQVSTKPGSGTSSSTGQLTAEGMTLAEIAQALTQELATELGRVVIDKTGIAGRYDVTLKWTPDASGAPADNGTENSSGPSIFTAMQEQLGLKLESTKGPVQVLVIDHVEMPSEN
ncbi:TIGR03435 family protein [Granulicella sp. S156]|uniref:TIGR03435 family protein n=1 Tax=Granulicella sp. S156 TaxID=1747224 RepID=UPI00131D0B1D|nr:TIGR03435 family protein [Granulicella sp. S156]